LQLANTAIREAETLGLELMVRKRTGPKETRQRVECAQVVVLMIQTTAVTNFLKILALRSHLAPGLFPVRTGQNLVSTLVTAAPMVRTHAMTVSMIDLPTRTLATLLTVASGCL
jgi:hypothetical protein